MDNLISYTKQFSKSISKEKKRLPNSVKAAIPIGIATGLAGYKLSRKKGNSIGKAMLHGVAGTVIGGSTSAAIFEIDRNNKW